MAYTPPVTLCPQHRLPEVYRTRVPGVRMPLKACETCYAETPEANRVPVEGPTPSTVSDLLREQDTIRAERWSS